MNDSAYMIASEGICSLIERMLNEGADFDEAVAELREQIEVCVSNKDEFLTL